MTSLRQLSFVAGTSSPLTTCLGAESGNFYLVLCQQCSTSTQATYLVPSAKKPRKEPTSRCSVPAPKSSKRKVVPEDAVDRSESQDDFAGKKPSVCTQTANKDAHRVSAYVSLIRRLHEQATYHRSNSKLQQQLDAAKKFYR